MGKRWTISELERGGRASVAARRSSRVSGEARRDRNRHGSAVIWLTGLSGSGKSTIAGALEAALFHGGAQVYGLDGDDLRQGLCRGLGFGQRDRAENIRRAGEVAALFADAGLIVIAALISPYRQERAAARAAVAPAPFVEVFVDCPLEQCVRRDPRGLYRRALAGEIPDFTGVSAPYERPVQPEVHLPTDRIPVSESVSRVVRHLERIGVLPPR